MLKHLVLSTILLYSASANAVSDGKLVSEVEYEKRNYLVNIVNGKTGSSCGAQVVAGQWLITARHCTPFYSNGAEWRNDEAVHGESMPIDVYQGVAGQHDENGLVYSGLGSVFTLGGDASSEQLLAESVGLTNPLLDAVACRTSDCSIRKKTNLVSDSFGSDIALIKLDKPIAYSTVLKIQGAFNFSNEYQLGMSFTDYAESMRTQVKLGDEIIFRGWGLDADGQHVTQMRSATMTILNHFFDAKCQARISRSEYEADCLTQNNAKSIQAKIKYSDGMELLGKTGNVNRGDSGTAITTSDNVMLGLASRTMAHGADFVAIESFIPWVQKMVSSVNAPTVINVSESKSLIGFDIQNLSDQPIDLSIGIAQGEAVVSSSCPTSLKPLDVCKVSVNKGKGNIAVSISDHVVTQINVIESTDKGSIPVMLMAIYNLIVFGAAKRCGIA